MKVKELKKLLEQVDDEALVVLSTDGEGNGYHALSTIDDSMVCAHDDIYDIELQFPKLTDELIKDGYSEADVYQGDDAVKCVVFWPVG